jgi:hypothetical protein
MNTDETNLLNETIQILGDHGHTPEEVLWVGQAWMCTQAYTTQASRNLFWFSWGEFAALAAVTDYNAGFGGAEIASDLVVVGDGWWLERHEYDGSEWWEHAPSVVHCLFGLRATAVSD